MTKRDSYKKGYGRAMKRSKKTDRLAGAVLAVYSGATVEEAARGARITRTRLEKALQNDGKQLEEGATPVTENGSIYSNQPTRLGEDGVPYGTEAAEQLIANRMSQLEASGRAANRQAVTRELVNGGRLQTMLPNAPQEQQGATPALAEQQQRRPAPGGSARLVELTDEDPAVRELGAAVRQEAFQGNTTPQQAFMALYRRQGLRNYSNTAWRTVAEALDVKVVG